MTNCYHGRLLSDITFDHKTRIKKIVKSTMLVSSVVNEKFQGFKMADLIGHGSKSALFQLVLFRCKILIT